MSAEAEMKPLALVTGAAHRIGRGLVLRLAERGYAIGLHYHTSEAAARETAAMIEGQGVAVVLLRADLRREDEIMAMFARLDEAGFDLRVLVNAAAVMPAGDLRTLTSQDWDDALDLNLRAPWLCAREAARRMQPGGVIVNISDAGAGKTWSGFPAYTISKAGVETLTRLLARTLAPGIRVNAVAPGLILKSPELAEERWEALVRRVPLGSAGDVEQVAQTVTFLIENAYITGQTIVVDGGFALI